MTSKEKVAALREEMQKNNVDAFIVYSADPHMSEYLPEEWQERAWLSGFLGSAGFVVVTKDKADFGQTEDILHRLLLNWKVQESIFSKTEWKELLIISTGSFLKFLQTGK
jgi:hypothetical protein